MNTPGVAYGLTGLAVAGVDGLIFASPRGGDSNDVDLASLTLPDLTPEQEGGRLLFEANCAVCHGKNAVGSDRGPPLVHRIYEPSHHSDIAFVLAAKQAVRTHHWRFGNISAIDSVTEDEVVHITAYVRTPQRANGIN
jgi:mono/diheme cytochrome c family protein